ncbi:unnamed protein product [Periconia digitata]|uniref:Uncharacterized protein n=1 Tax=Periconia digitata TaxID=1303443 RepID=A0A9W4UIT4_9PLEO|nr:unnamed protein product [Periconia digitata]
MHMHHPHSSCNTIQIQNATTSPLPLSLESFPPYQTHATKNSSTHLCSSSPRQGPHPGKRESKNGSAELLIPSSPPLEQKKEGVWLRCIVHRSLDRFWVIVRY